MSCIDKFQLPNGETIKFKDIDVISEPKLNVKKFLLSFFKSGVKSNYYVITKKNGESITIFEDDDLIRYKSLVHFMMVFEKQQYFKKRNMVDISEDIM